ncbi:MAG: hypothetical protein FD155_1819 [Bacteroidetes bacterium]|nr:MAG: hypothetical protein FD155_1819 [Bacteroidota bacterium]
MEAIIIPKDQFQQLMSRIEQISAIVEKLKPPTKFIDNSEFAQIMKISKRTAQNWRDEKVIAYSQIGAKIYYIMTDIEKLLESNYTTHPTSPKNLKQTPQPLKTADQKPKTKVQKTKVQKT